MEEKMKTTHTTMAWVQNTQLVEMEANKKKAEDDLTKPGIDFASTKR
jgi:hypothetical protein